MNAVSQLDFELANYDVMFLDVNRYAMGISVDDFESSNIFLKNYCFFGSPNKIKKRKLNVAMLS